MPCACGALLAGARHRQLRKLQAAGFRGFGRGLHSLHVFCRGHRRESARRAGQINPPIRPAAEREKLWAHLAAGNIDLVSTDHVAWSLYRKNDPNMLANSSGGSSLREEPARRAEDRQSSPSRCAGPRIRKDRTKESRARSRPWRLPSKTKPRCRRRTAAATFL